LYACLDILQLLMIFFSCTDSTASKSSNIKGRTEIDVAWSN
jgi:hypothetical protein